MQQALLSRECGENGYGFHEYISNRWANVRLDPMRRLDAIFASSLNAIDIDHPAGLLLLCGGVAESTQTQLSGCLGVFRLSAERAKAQPDPVAVSTDFGKVSPPIICAKWFPEDPAIFIAGGSTGDVMVWDTECFEVATSIPVADSVAGETELTALDMSCVPGAKTEIVAAARMNYGRVKLIDIGSGASIHEVGYHDASILDVKWSSQSPYLLASASSDGSVQMFDVRRSGNSACLLTLDRSKVLPIHDTPEVQMRKLQKRLRMSSGRAALNDAETYGSGARLLGLRCAWESASASQERYRKRRLESRGRTGSGRAHFQACTRIRFTPDGSGLVSAGRDGRYRLWDTFTGHCLLSTLGGKGRNSSTVFEVARDSIHLFSNCNGMLVVEDLENGDLVSRRRGHLRDMRAMCVHPINEELYSSSGSEIMCWSGAVKRERGESQVATDQIDETVYFS